MTLDHPESITEHVGLHACVGATARGRPQQRQGRLIERVDRHLEPPSRRGEEVGERVGEEGAVRRRLRLGAGIDDGTPPPRQRLDHQRLTSIDSRATSFACFRYGTSLSKISSDMSDLMKSCFVSTKKERWQYKQPRLQRPVMSRW